MNSCGAESQAYVDAGVGGQHRDRVPLEKSSLLLKRRVCTR
jgi:hypothetical protein